MAKIPAVKSGPKFTLLFPLLLAAIVVVILLVTNNSSPQTQTPAQSSQAPATSIKFSNDGRTVTYQGVEGKTALELLRAQTSVESQTSSLGEYVTAINGVKSTKTKFWLYYVNGKQAQVGADKYQTKNGDAIEWRLEAGH